MRAVLLEACGDLVFGIDIAWQHLDSTVGVTAREAATIGFTAWTHNDVCAWQQTLGVNEALVHHGLAPRADWMWWMQWLRVDLY